MGTRILTSSYDGTACVWSVPSFASNYADILLRENSSYGIRVVGACGSISRVTAVDNQGAGIDAAMAPLQDCEARRNTGVGMHGAVATNCTSKDNGGTGIVACLRATARRGRTRAMGLYVTGDVVDCFSLANGATGIWGVGQC